MYMGCSISISEATELNVMKELALSSLIANAVALLSGTIMVLDSSELSNTK